MAGDWIKMRSNLWDHPKVVRIVSAICPQNVRNLSERARIIGALFRTWTLADAHTDDGVLDGYDAEALDSAVGIEGWSLNLQHVGWLIVESQRLIVPRFEEHNGESAKRRAEDASRKRRVRKMSEECPQNVRKKSDQRREEKRRDIKGVNPLKPPALVLPSVLDTETFRAAWCTWVDHRTQIKKPLKEAQVGEQLKMLAGIGHDAALAMVRHTVAMGWQGLKAPEAPKAAFAGVPSRPLLPKIGDYHDDAD